MGRRTRELRRGMSDSAGHEGWTAEEDEGKDEDEEGYSADKRRFWGSAKFEDLESNVS